ncbi:MAG TPA: hypothetical protein V6C76_11620 [Drouetiella sp.]
MKKVTACLIATAISFCCAGSSAIAADVPATQAAPVKKHKHPFRAAGHFAMKAATLPIFVGTGFVVGGFVGHIRAIIGPYTGAVEGVQAWHTIWGVQEELTKDASEK